ncbi:MFS transporter [Aurantibacter crassamenti]|uniref:MFS transporter n=1 Tax=Aurantibacter crassamenti TaxID=1837375 RepID=UPI00193A7EEF|nr:MFS transporter [Aurantibacter crassamenti]MBM1107632.1 MFS transporter [Aurantibacter crassamenti]
MKQKASWYYLTLLILAGEAVFILPFVLPRIFRATVLEVFQLENVELGFCFSIYGVVALVSYLLGGPIADRYPPRKLMAIALWMTAFGGLLFATFPSYRMLKVLYGFWGFTTIFLFWAPMIKAARIWGGSSSQGKAFGLLDGGRGMTGALFGLMGVFVFSIFVSENIETALLSNRKLAFQNVIYCTVAIITTIGFLTWFFMKSDVDEIEIRSESITYKQIGLVINLPAVKLLMVIILCAYVGYKITDILSQYANEVLHYNQVKSAKIGTFLQFLRPVIGVMVGLVVDRFKISLCLVYSFLMSIIGGLLFASGLIEPSATALFFLSVVVIAIGVYAARSLYFALMEEGRIPLIYTGTAVGLISLVGFTPDIFAGLAYGYLLDKFPGELGYQYIFLMLVGFSVVGGIAAFRYYRTFNGSEKLTINKFSNSNKNKNK